MKPAEVDSLVKAVVAPYLTGELAFEYVDGVFYREVGDGVRHIVMIDVDIRTGRTFRVIVGFNAATISCPLAVSEAGVFGVRYLTKGGLSAKPSNFACHSTSDAIESLKTIVSHLKTEVVSWLSGFDKLEQLAAIVEENYPFIKGKLLFASGRRELARPYLEKHLEYLRVQRQSPSVVEGRVETEEMLGQV